ncbi:MAG: ABC transporter substrate-binding protein [Lachnospiraceae bacterium]|nr:ABC transporter substrate-binding protein [Lachnospiraceae bacterium]
MEKMRKIMAILLAALMVLSLAACTNTPKTSESEVNTTAENTTKEEPTTAPSTEAPETTAAPESTEEAKTTHTVTDHAGNEVEVPNTVERIAVCDVYPLPSILAVFFDSAEKIVGMAPQSMSAAKNSILGQVYPEILNASTAFTDGTAVNTEELLKLDTDVVFYNAGNKALGEQLKNAGICAVAISAGKWQYDAIATLNGWIETFDQIIPQNDKKEKVEAYAKSVYDEVGRRVSALKDEEKEKVLFLFQYTDTNMQLNGNPSFGTWWSEAIGANNVVSEATPKNSMEADIMTVYDLDPSVIFITNFTTAKPDDLYENRIGTDNWKPVDAVKNKRVYKMPLGMYRSYTAGVDAPIALWWLAKACYPALFEDIDITEKTVGYYRDVFGITLTAEQANAIFDPDPNAGIMK